MDEEELRRLRWRSRRGLLELDLVLDRFWAGAGAGITREEAAALERLLRLPDNDLLDLVMGRGQAPEPDLRDMLDKLRGA
jgi:succinate dehydrogenase flavin-adding protein (antitoxin of CptAB toxin-antitoxin module)